jgi:N-methylhydantoinase A
MIGVDVGGTFTDVVATRNGVIEVTKVPTEVVLPQRAVLEGARRIGVGDMSSFNHASTHGLNAVITRNLPKIGFITTEGHRDMLDAGRAWRPRAGLTDPAWHRGFSDAARPLVPRYLRLGVRERVLADGTVLMELDEDHARRQAELLKRCAVRGVAICTLNAYINAEHEVRLREIMHEVLGDIPIVVSSDVSPLAKEYTRASTTVIDVLMKLIYSSYAQDLAGGLDELGFSGELNFADCAATMMSRDRALEQAHRIVFAGPAAGTAASQRVGALIDEPNLVCCDVGGTSTDVSLVVSGKAFVNHTFEIEHDLVINALSTEVSSVGAGGGSLITVSPSGDIKVGPESAGADPGPACYGRGGTNPTVTDACLLMGILDGKGFAGGDFQLDQEKALAAFEKVDAPVSVEQRIGMAYRVAVNNIAEEITNVAVRHGLDTRDFSVMAYGAAGGMLLPAALDLLRAKRVIVPPHPGLFSALGLLSTDRVYSDSRSAYVMLSPDAATQVGAMFDDIEAKLRERVGDEARNARVRRSFDGRLIGQSWETPFVAVPEGPIGQESVTAMIASFHEEYERRFGQRMEALPVEGVTYRVELIIPTDKVEYPEVAKTERPPTPIGSTTLSYLEGAALRASVYDRTAMRAGDEVVGPAIIREALSTTLVCSGQIATIGRIGEIVIEFADRA